jgi:hypothetical protein
VILRRGSGGRSGRMDSMRDVLAPACLKWRERLQGDLANATFGVSCRRWSGCRVTGPILARALLATAPVLILGPLWG